MRLALSAKTCMPITESPTPGEPLTQGDILQGIRLFFSKRGAAATWECAEDSKIDLCLVLARQCVVEHKKMLIVAAVDRYPKDTPNDLDFKDVELFLEDLRAGNKSPDLFYLGQLPGMQGRFCARLDSLHTIEIPQIPAERQTFVDGNRVAKLNMDFVRDLHMRVLGAFGNMGFEDYRWLSDADLKWLVAKGQAEIVKEQEDQKTAALARKAEGKPTEVKQTNRDQNVIATLRKRLEPYAKEMARRFPEPPATEAGVERAG